jgi:hypothetical protein
MYSKNLLCVASVCHAVAHRRRQPRQPLRVIYTGEVSRGERTALRETDPESYIVDCISEYEEKSGFGTGVIQK